MRHPTSLIVGVVGHQPARDRGRRPAGPQLPAHHRPQPRGPLNREALRAGPDHAGHLVGAHRPIVTAAAVTSDFAADHRRVSADPSRDLNEQQILGQPAENLLPVGLGQHPAHDGASFPTEPQDQVLRPPDPKGCRCDRIGPARFRDPEQSVIKQTGQMRSTFLSDNGRRCRQPHGLRERPPLSGRIRPSSVYRVRFGRARGRFRQRRVPGRGRSGRPQGLGAGSPHRWLC